MSSGDVTVSIPSEQIDMLVGSDLLKLLAPEERHSLIVEAIRKVLDDYSTRNLVLRAMQPEVEKAVREVATEMQGEIKRSVQTAIAKLIEGFPKRMTS